MINAMMEYKTEHDFGAAASLEGFLNLLQFMKVEKLGTS